MMRKEKYTLAADVRYQYNLNKINNAENRYLNDNLSDIFVFGFYDVSDDISLLNFQFSVGFFYHLNYKVVRKNSSLLGGFSGLFKKKNK